MIYHHPTEPPRSAEPSEAGDDLGACPLAGDRRRFLRDAGLAVIAALTAAGAAPSAGLAARVGTLTPGPGSGTTHSYPIPTADGVFIDSANAVILARWQGRMYAFSLRCPHRGTRLEWRPDEERIFCPKHRARFRPDGAHAGGRSTRPLDRYPVTRRGGSIVVDLSTTWRADQNAAAWAAAVAPLA
jgi:nitrite reductase/ring-hydroxylating ferredoxin subunit